MTAIYAILMFCVLIFIHELGHFVAAKASGVKVNQFALGMGPALFKFQRVKRSTRFAFFPSADIVPWREKIRSRRTVVPLTTSRHGRRPLSSCIGSFMNLVLAVLLMTIVVYHIGTATTTVASLVKDSPAIEAGIMEEIRS